MILTTSINEIKAFRPCPSGWKRLIEGMNNPPESKWNNKFPLVDTLNTNTVSDVLWLIGKRRVEISIAVRFARKCADSVKHLNTEAAAYADAAAYATAAADATATAATAYAATATAAAAAYAADAAATANAAADATATAYAYAATATYNAAAYNAATYNATATATAYAATATATYNAATANQKELNKQFLIEEINNYYD